MCCLGPQMPQGKGIGQEEQSLRGQCQQFKRHLAPGPLRWAGRLPAVPAGEVWEGDLGRIVGDWEEAGGAPSVGFPIA